MEGQSHCLSPGLGVTSVPACSTQPALAEPSSPSTQPQQDPPPSPHAGLLEGALPAQPDVWQHLEQMWPLTLPTHGCKQVEVACPQAFRSLLLLKHNPMRRGSLLAMQKAARL